MKSAPRLVLASASPRRVELLRQLHLDFDQIVSPEAELSPTDEPPAAQAVQTAAAKAQAVQRLLQRTQPERPAFILGADTVVCLDGEVLGKPRDEADARATLGKLAGRQHQVYTGLSLIPPGGEAHDAYTATQVHMRPISQADIAAYVRSGEPMDKAGSYGIQGLAARFVERIEGCYFNVVGLPLSLACALLEEAGYPNTAFHVEPRP